jgi:GMP synthase-like glutamine amidotransferase
MSGETLPVLILQHLSSDGPAYLGQWLVGQRIDFDVRDAEAGEPYPADMRDHRALAVLGGEMSANDELPGLRQAEVLIRDAMNRGRPVIGHCLGGQLMARALGASVVASPAPEIGWQPLQVEDDPAALGWFGHAGTHTVFQWHEEAFELPPGARPLAGSAACPHQAFSIGRHLAMQFHVELDFDKLARWSLLDTPDYRAAQQQYASSVQSGAAMRAAAADHLSEQQRLAARIYARWLGVGE